MSDAFLLARQLVGTPVKQLGRDPRFGLDCIGVALCAYGLEGRSLAPYRQSDGSWTRILVGLGSHFEEVGRDDAQSGDLAVMQLPMSFHFAVLGPAALVHADLRIGRVVERPFRRLPKRGRFFRFTGVRD